eukprot:1394627-Amorphochlora_amoeboformis.AAC.1
MREEGEIVAEWTGRGEGRRMCSFNVERERERKEIEDEKKGQAEKRSRVGTGVTVRCIIVLFLTRFALLGYFSSL